MPSQAPMTSPEIPQRLRAVDAVPPAGAALLILQGLLTGRHLLLDENALRAWGAITLVYLVAVIAPRVIAATPALSARARAIAGHALLAALALALLAFPSVGRSADPFALGVLALILFLVYGAGRARGEFAPARFLYAWSPFLLAALAYANLGAMLPVPAHTMDAELSGLDALLLRTHPSIALHAFATPLRNDWFSFHYAIYIAYPIVAGLALYATSRREEFERLFLRVAAALWLANVCYALVPARGPGVFLASSLGGPLQGGLITRMMEGLVGGYGYGYDVFPSLHTAVSLLAVFALRRPFPRAFGIALFFEANLLLSTLWLRMHYGVDLLAGVLYALAIHAAATAAERVLARRRAADATADVSAAR